jgi:hypothetical protein
MINYREWYGASAPNIGLKLTVEAVAKGIAKLESGEKVNGGASVIDPATFSQDGGPSIAERMFDQGVVFARADNKRTGKMGGWDMLRHRLDGDEDGTPMVFFFATCKDIIRTLPMLQHDKTNPEDLDTDSEDHAADSVRYGVMSRPWARPKPLPLQDVLLAAIRPMTYDDLHKLQARRRL